MTPDIMLFTPSVGVTSIELCFIQYFYKNHSSNLCTQLQILLVLKAAHTAADFLITQNPLRIQLQRSSTHTAGT